MLFTGSARTEGIVVLMEMGTVLAVIESCFDVDFNDADSDDSQCRPWNYELFCADTSEGLRATVGACLQERISSDELWIACAHFHGEDAHFHLLRTETLDTSDSDSTVNSKCAWDCIIAMEFKTMKAPPTKEFFRTLVFWRDENTGNTLPWNKQNS
jgi:hypothetical protein